MATRAEAEPVEADRPREGGSADRGDLEARFASRRVFLLQPRDAVGTDAGMDRLRRLDAAIDPQASNRREIFQGAAPRRLVEVPGVAKAVLPDQDVEIRFRLVHDDARAAR